MNRAIKRMVLNNMKPEEILYILKVIYQKEILHTIQVVLSL